ncbi:MAG: glycosyltransferase [Candidatus Marinimicrobia bacterium]|jgi:glycosyltransferase involved in cell wall biosynthesis|nr:glycosyltransferase [Candidatus Neomarinimicrobiota bacterium]MBT3574529.1 glycosyltransferase [Candidatus Neomarinimicrobiota bacterium]MBT3678720.1 glycosyltransferase [Candidatus Neomarinimicrobiota bacterium]MBT3952205.1 glycosyltransferase [Candidatus Neomarinimicrobiota bacterium]MBT4252992.1 glycosyltransferase [Candidatus Neomarinimicrobiota bacterium]
MKNFCKDLTVGIPYHWGSDPSQLIETLDSVIGQSLRAGCCHLIQNGNVSDQICEIVDGYTSKHAEFKKIHVEKRGLAAALNTSLLQCTTRYYARMDSDDIALPQRFEKQISYLEAHEDVQILGGWAKEFSTSEGVANSVLKQMPVDQQEMQNWFHYRNPFIHSTIVFRTEVFKNIGYYDETYLTDQDLELWGRAINANVQLANIPEVLIYFRTDNVIGRRSQFSAIKRQAVARFSVTTYSLKYNLLKLAALTFRLMPRWIQKLGYKNLR